MTKEEYIKRIEFLFPEESCDITKLNLNGPNPFMCSLVKGKLSRNYNRHNCRIVKAMCFGKLNDLIGLENKKKCYKVKEN